MLGIHILKLVELVLELEIIFMLVEMLPRDLENISNPVPSGTASLRAPAPCLAGTTRSTRTGLTGLTIVLGYSIGRKLNIECLDNNSILSRGINCGNSYNFL